MSGDKSTDGHRRNACADVRVQDWIIAYQIAAECPHCGEMQLGFLSDPRGVEFECDDCGGSYIISRSATINI